MPSDRGSGPRREPNGRHTVLENTETSDFDLDDLDLGVLSVAAMTDSVALPEGGASYRSSSTCYVAEN